MPIETSTEGLDQLEAELTERVMKILHDAATTTEEAAIHNCPVDETKQEGTHLYETIRSEEVEELSVAVIAGDLAQGVDYATYVEMGTVHPVGPKQGQPKKEPYTIPPQPYLGPAYELGRAYVEEHGGEVLAQ
jgi:HK97 gp10 family phage protein